ncbi:MAG: spermidine synthase [Janthinobacterium lividum]
MRGGDELVLRDGRDPVVLVPDPARRSAFLLRVGRTDQSYVDLDDPLRLEFDYVQRIADLVESLFEPGRTLRAVHVGGAGLTLPRYLAATRPGSVQTVLEPDAELTDFVRARLPLPRGHGIKVRAVDGRSGLPALNDGIADLVVLDAFSGAQVPPDLTTDAALAELHRVLHPDGVLALNVTDRGPLAYTRRVLAGLRARFAVVGMCAEPSTLKGRRFGNLVLLATDRPLGVAAWGTFADRAGRPPFPYRVQHGARLDQLVGGARPYTDEDAEPSPAPPMDLLGLG